VTTETEENSRLMNGMHAFERGSSPDADVARVAVFARPRQSLEPLQPFGAWARREIRGGRRRIRDGTHHLLNGGRPSDLDMKRGWSDSCRRVFDSRSHAPPTQTSEIQAPSQEHTAYALPGGEKTAGGEFFWTSYIFDGIDPIEPRDPLITLLARTERNLLTLRL